MAFFFQIRTRLIPLKSLLEKKGLNVWTFIRCRKTYDWWPWANRFSMVNYICEYRHYIYLVQHSTFWGICLPITKCFRGIVIKYLVQHGTSVPPADYGCGHCYQIFGEAYTFLCHMYCYDSLYSSVWLPNIWCCQVIPMSHIYSLHDEKCVAIDYV